MGRPWGLSLAITGYLGVAGNTRLVFSISTRPRCTVAGDPTCELQVSHCDSIAPDWGPTPP